MFYVSIFTLSGFLDWRHQHIVGQRLVNHQHYFHQTQLWETTNETALLKQSQGIQNRHVGSSSWKCTGLEHTKCAWIASGKSMATCCFAGEAALCREVAQKSSQLWIPACAAIVSYCGNIYGSAETYSTCLEGTKIHSANLLGLTVVEHQ